jgi:hypothetical protein
MTPDPGTFLHWITTMTPDKLAVVVPFVIGYVIVRTKSVHNDFIWPICMIIGAVLFWLLEPSEASKTTIQDSTTRVGVGLVLGFCAAFISLGMHSVAFKWIANKWPALNFLVLPEDDLKTPNDKLKPVQVTTDQDITQEHQ